MNWIGTAVGGAFGFLVGGPVGAVIGASVGHQFIKGSITLNINRPLDFSTPHAAQQAFFTATFAVMGHIAKSSGRVTPEKIAFANQVMTEMALTEDLRRTAIELFQQGKNPHFSLDQALAQFHQACHAHRDLLIKFLDIQLQTAVNNGVLGSVEEAILLHICNQLNIPRFEYERLKLRLQIQQGFKQNSSLKPNSRSSLKEAYSVLGLRPEASQAEVKKAYRTLMNKYHPDKLAAQGLSEAQITLSTEKTQKINKAYEIIQKSF
jgi:DnaJ like chaperone protein